MVGNYTLNSILRLNYNKEGVYSSLKVGKVISVSFDIVKNINQLNKKCWEELSNQFYTYKQNRAYYIKYGGTCPSLEYQLEYKEKLQELKEIKKFILSTITSIKNNHWLYDIGYCKYIRKLREILC